jgi:hypothetical protein
MFWGCITNTGTGALLPCSNHMNSADYIRNMEAACIPVSGSFGLTYMDDNAPIHRSKMVQAWKADNDVAEWDWPPYSPDINPIENVWAFIKNKINKMEHKPDNLTQLNDIVYHVWSSIPLTFI